MHPSQYLSLHLPRPPKLSWRGRLMLLAALAATLYLVGFAAYIVMLPKPYATVPENLEGIAIFTGGSGRVGTGLGTLHQGFGGPILISGIHPQNTLGTILSGARLPLTLTPAQQQLISMDTAQTTQENIRSTAAWAKGNGLRHIGIVTSTYHAARVTWLARWHAPGLAVTILPVQPANAGLKTLVQEYNKLLAAPFLN